MLTIKSDAATAATRCSAFQARHMAATWLERLAAGKARLQVVPVADLVFTLDPAEVHLAVVADRREVDEAAVEVAQHDLGLLQPGERFA